MKRNNFNLIYFIIQVRSGSTRLPNKMLMPFYKGKTIPEIIINKLISLGISKMNIIIATTTNKNDDLLIDILSNYGCQVFRGDENNVLNRFINAAKTYNANLFFRICADNPFLNTCFLLEMLQTPFLNKINYLTYQLKDGTPAIRTHFGLFCEYTTLKTLEFIATKSNNLKQTEHVTPYIYENREQFIIKTLSIPNILQENNWLRLTIDTEKDFIVAQEIFAMINNSENLTELIQISQSYKEIMINNININTK